MKTCRAQYLLWFTVAVLGAGSLLAACGQKGALYLPEPVEPAPKSPGDAQRVPPPPPTSP